VQANACWAVANLAVVAENQGPMVEQYAHRIVLNSMREHANCVAVQHKGVWALINLMSSTKNQQLLKKYGGLLTLTDAIHFLLVAMRNNLVNPTGISEDIQHCGMWLLAALSTDAENRQQIVRESGHTAIIRAMRAHPDNQAIQQCGAWGLRNLCLDPETVQLVERAEGVGTIISGMSRHRDALDVQLHSVWGLINLSDNHDVKLRVIKEGGLTAVIEALQAHVTSLDMCRACFIALVNFSDKGPTLVRMVKEKAHLAVLDAMECHASRAEMQHYACWCLSNMADHPSNKVVVATDGAQTLVQKALKNFRDFPEVQSHGFAALKAMTLNTENLHMCASSKRYSEITHSVWSGLDFQGDRPGYSFSTGATRAPLLSEYEALEPPPAYDTGHAVYVDRAGGYQPVE